MKAGAGTGVDIGPDSQDESRRTSFVAPTPEEVARLFPQLEILGFIGQGGMGAVYKARQKALDRVVALKILPPGIGGDPAFAERFTREAKALAKLNHPGIVTLYEFGQADGLFFFLMEFVDGVNLRHLLEVGRVSPREALAIVPQICDALQYAHDQGIVHRDIKPENILLDRQGHVKVADFGLAKLVGTEGERYAAGGGSAGSIALTEAGKVMGTPQYMAPEQREHPAEVDHRADIYSLGVVFYQMLTGELPRGPERYEPPSRKVLIDVRLDEVVLRALHREPARRYQQVSEIRTQVETIVGGTVPADRAANVTGGAPSHEVAERSPAWPIAFCLAGLVWLAAWGYAIHLHDRPWKIVTDVVGFAALQIVALGLAVRLWRKPVGKLIAVTSVLMLAGTAAFVTLYVWDHVQAGQYMHVRGLVFDEVTQEPIPGARIAADFAPDRSHVADEWTAPDGDFGLRTLRRKQVLVVSAAGYEEVRWPVSGDLGNRDYCIWLKPKSLAGGPTGTGDQQAQAAGKDFVCPLEATIYEVHLSGDASRLDSNALRAAASTPSELQTALKHLGQARMLYRIYQSVKLAGDRVSLNEKVPVVIATRKTDSGATINTFSYMDVGAVIHVAGTVQPDGLVSAKLDLEVCALVDTPVRIGPQVYDRPRRVVSMGHNGPITPGVPLVVFSVAGSASDAGSKPTAYVARIVMGKPVPVAGVASRPATPDARSSPYLLVQAYRLDLPAGELAKLKQSLAASTASSPRFDPALRREGSLSDVGMVRMSVPLDGGGWAETAMAEKIFATRREVHDTELMVRAQGQLRVSVESLALGGGDPPAGTMTVDVSLSDLKDASRRATTLPAVTVSPFQCRYDGPVVLGLPVQIWTAPGPDKCVYVVWLRLVAPRTGAATRPARRPTTAPARPAPSPDANRSAQLEWSQEAQKTVDTFLGALRRNAPAAAYEQTTADYRQGHQGGLERLVKIADLSKTKPVQAHVAMEAACLVVSPITVQGRDGAVSLGLGMIRVGDRYFIRDLDMLPNEQATTKYLAGFNKAYPAAANVLLGAAGLALLETQLTLELADAERTLGPQHRTTQEFQAKLAGVRRAMGRLTGPGTRPAPRGPHPTSQPGTGTEALQGKLKEEKGSGTFVLP